MVNFKKDMIYEFRIKSLLIRNAYCGKLKKSFAPQIKGRAVRFF